nr:dephospho-CoA kinase [Arthrobacter sp. H16F315]
MKIGLTGGIAAGKSVASSRLRELGAIVIDADALAREVVEPGTPGLAKVVEAFSKSVLTPDGGLDRAKLGALVFGNPDRLAVLNNIIHPLVRERAAALSAAAPMGAVVVQDIPLLVETGQGSNFHLVVVVDAPDEARLQRMVQHRRMSPADARARMAAQAGRQDRLAAADVVLDNSGSKQELRDAVDRLWKFRLAPFAENLGRHRPAPRTGAPVPAHANPEWPVQAARLMARLRTAAGENILALHHVGSTAVPGLGANDVLDLQLGVEDMAAADRISLLLAEAGFPARPVAVSGNPQPPHPDPASWPERLHANADPGRAVNLHVRAVGSPGWRFALCFRDWLRDDPAAREEYLAEKRLADRLHGADRSTAGYASDTEDGMAGHAPAQMEAWARRTGWQPPLYPGPEAGPERTAQS